MEYKEKKIQLLVVSPLYPPHIGGLESHAEQWNKHIAYPSGSKQRYVITVFTPRTSAGGRQHETSNGIATYRYPAFEIIPNYPVPKVWNPLFWRLLKHATTPKPDIVISRTRFFLTSLIALVLSKRHAIPWLHIEHGSDYVHLNNKLSALLARLYDRTLGASTFRRADVVVANSKASAAFVTKISGRKHIPVIYRGVDHKKIELVSPARDITQRHPNKLIITFVGRLIDGKGVADLLRASRNVTLLQTDRASAVADPDRLGAGNGIKCHLLIVGDGPQRKYLELLSKRLGISSIVTFLGEQDFDRTIAILKATDIFVNPSYTEGLPTSVIEAALCKCAIIATPVGGTREIVSSSKSVVFFNSGDTKQLSRSILQLFNNEQMRTSLAANAHDEVKLQFSWDSAVEQYQTILATMVATYHD